MYGGVAGVPGKCRGVDSSVGEGARKRGDRVAGASYQRNNSCGGGRNLKYNNL